MARKSSKAPASPDLPDALRSKVDEIVQLLALSCQGADYSETGRANQLFDEVAHEAYLLGESLRHPQHPEPDETPVDSFDDYIRQALKDRRADAEWSQRSVAEAINRLGFNWTRVTVAEIESGARRCSLEELFALCVLFDTAMVDFLTGGNWPFRLPNGTVIDFGLVTQVVQGDNISADTPRIASALIAGVDLDDLESDWRPCAVRRRQYLEAAALRSEEQAKTPKSRYVELPEDVYGTPEWRAKQAQALRELDERDVT